MSTWPTSTAFLVPANAHAGLGDVFDERFASFQVDGIVTDDEDVTSLQSSLSSKPELWGFPMMETASRTTASWM